MLRRAATPAERVLWSLLRARRVDGAKFRRQQPLGPFVVDFFCAEHRLVVEADGGYHVATRARDAERDRWLWIAGLSVLRLTNEEILEHPERALRRIRRALRATRAW